MRKTLKSVSLFAGVALLLVFGFQNCGFKVPQGTGVSASKSPNPLQDLMSLGYASAVNVDLSKPSSLIEETAWARPPSEPGYDIIVVAGQSNASGYGEGPHEEIMPEQDARIFQLTRYPQNQLPKIQPVNGHALEHVNHNPAHANIKNKVGFALTFARIYASRLPPQRKVLLIPAARGSSSLLEWLGELDTNAPATGLIEDRPDYVTMKDFLYPDMLTRIQYALTLPRDNPGHNRVAALLWLQGEKDFGFLAGLGQGQPDYNPQAFEIMNSPSAFHDHLKNLIQKIRRDLKSQGDFPILIGDLVPLSAYGTGVTNDLRASMSEAFQDQTRLFKNVAYVSTECLISNTHIRYPTPACPRSTRFGIDSTIPSKYLDGSDSAIDTANVHFNAQSQVELGERFAETLHQLTDGAPVELPAQLSSPYAAQVRLPVPAGERPGDSRQAAAFEILRRLATLFPEPVEISSLRPEAVASEGVNVFSLHSKNRYYLVAINLRDEKIALTFRGPPSQPMSRAEALIKISAAGIASTPLPAENPVFSATWLEVDAHSASLLAWKL